MYPERKTIFSGCKLIGELAHDLLQTSQLLLLFLKLTPNIQQLLLGGTDNFLSRLCSSSQFTHMLTITSDNMTL